MCRRLARKRVACFFAAVAPRTMCTRLACTPPAACMPNARAAHAPCAQSACPLPRAGHCAAYAPHALGWHAAATLPPRRVRQPGGAHAACGRPASNPPRSCSRAAVGVRSACGRRAVGVRSACGRRAVLWARRCRYAGHRGVSWVGWSARFSGGVPLDPLGDLCSFHRVANAVDAVDAVDADLHVPDGEVRTALLRRGPLQSVYPPRSTGVRGTCTPPSCRHRGAGAPPANTMRAAPVLTARRVQDALGVIGRRTRRALEDRACCTCCACTSGSCRLPDAVAWPANCRHRARVLDSADGPLSASPAELLECAAGGSFRPGFPPGHVRFRPRSLSACRAAPILVPFSAPTTNVYVRTRYSLKPSQGKLFLE